MPHAGLSGRRRARRVLQHPRDGAARQPRLARARHANQQRPRRGGGAGTHGMKLVWMLAGPKRTAISASGNCTAHPHAP